MRIDKQAEHEKHHNLRKPRDAVDKLRYAPMPDHTSVTHRYAAKIYRQITIAAEP